MSLGVDLVPMKTCSLSCIYCQIGRTPRTTVERRRFSDPDELVGEVNAVLRSRSDIDYITLSGSGEPTLEIGIGEIIRRLKEVSETPVAVLTNGTMFVYPEVREAVKEADLILPSLDAATEEVFQRINRPHESLTLDMLVEGLEHLRREHTGAIWLEVMLVKGVNDDESHLHELARIVRKVRPDRVQLNTPVRPPAETDVRPLDLDEMEAARDILGSEAEIIADVAPETRHVAATAVHEPVILALAERRPVTAEEVSAAAGIHLAETLKYLAALERSGKLRRTVHGGKTFYATGGIGD
jgi:wyosine [tRNA(Phe)-imidazoG37] synthetase (radical SAM superfamily)